jgi:glutamate--cysteine ligase
MTIALDGLRRRARLDRNGEDERKALEPLLEMLEAGRSPADWLLAEYRGPWRGDIDKIFETAAL